MMSSWNPSLSRRKSKNILRLKRLLQTLKVIPELHRIKKQGKLEQFYAERRSISKSWNDDRQSIAMLSCTLNSYLKSIKSRGSSVSTYGGFCKDSRSRSRADKGLVSALCEFFKNESIGDFGAGKGRYQGKLLKCPNVLSYDAYDGAYFRPETTNGSVQFLDLTIKQYGLPIYDWVISIEVGEHIPKKYEKTFLENLVRHARKGMILSWAVPGQGGVGHINRRSIDYVIKKMAALGFEVDEEKSQQIRGKAGDSRLRRNIRIYYRRNDSHVDPSEAKK